MTDGVTKSVTAAKDEISGTARDLHFRSIVIDTHADTTQRLIYDGFDLGARHADGSVDIPRMREGGVGAIFFAIWTLGTVTGPEAARCAMQQIDAVRKQVTLHSSDLVLARTAADIRHARADGRIAILMGLEGGHMMNGDLDVLRRFASLGVSYVTLTHTRTTDWCDASTDKPAHNGLSDFGKDVIREMNRLGMIVDVSHASDKAFADVLEVSRAPVFASHSSCRALCPAARNLSDEMIQALAAKRGLVQINFHMAFISREFREAEKANPQLEIQIDEEAKRICGENMSCQLLESDRIVRTLVGKGKLPRVEWTEIIRHVEHAVKIAEADHVGLGSDFDGAAMPYGMEDASCLPRITGALLDKGYSESDTQKILGGNVLRLMQDVEAAAESMRGNAE
ncbi:MAG TPA: dipeptidase [Candidatus Acidoferrales bacterium]|nr:dipeptidase [Candidatus Acidoferrales bacterium]